MGAWGVGIYSNDTALDLKATLTSILRLPLDPDEILDLLDQQEPALADVDDEDHTDCWFVVADRFHRYGIDHAETLARVRRYVESGKDREMKAVVGLPPADLRARQAAVRSLLERISAPHPKPARRRTLRHPQPFLLEPGELITYPVQEGRCFNPYQRDWASSGFEPDGDAVALIIDRGHAFGYLAWYTAAPLHAQWSSVRPTLRTALETEFAGTAAGTLSPAHHKKLGITTLEVLRLGPGVSRLPPPFGGGEHVAINDICLSNGLDLDPEAFSIDICLADVVAS